MKHTLVVLVWLFSSPVLSGTEFIDIGSRRELFVDDYLVDSLKGARCVMHHPTPREIVLTHDAPWEGSGCGYHSVFRDGDLYRRRNLAREPHPRPRERALVHTPLSDGPHPDRGTPDPERGAGAPLDSFLRRREWIWLS